MDSGARTGRVVGSRSRLLGVRFLKFREYGGYGRCVRAWSRESLDISGWEGVGRFGF